MTDTAVDSALVHRARAVNSAAFEELVNRYEARVYTLARRIVGQEQDAEDVTQQTFLSAGTSGWFPRGSEFLHVADADRHPCGAQGDPQTQGTADGLVGRDDRAQEGYEGIPHPEFIADWRQSPEELVRNNETQRLLDEALAELDENHRVVFLLRDVEGMSVKRRRMRWGLAKPM